MLRAREPACDSVNLVRAAKRGAHEQVAVQVRAAELRPEQGLPGLGLAHTCCRDPRTSSCAPSGCRGTRKVCSYPLCCSPLGGRVLQVRCLLWQLPCSCMDYMRILDVCSCCSRVAPATSTPGREEMGRARPYAARKPPRGYFSGAARSSQRGVGKGGQGSPQRARATGNQRARRAMMMQ